jgi:RimJ/RimL family protein N-acetyltransferase
MPELLLAELWSTGAPRFGQALTMDVLTFTDAAAFAERVGPVIDRYPAFASVLASNLDQSVHGSGFDTNWYLIRDGGQPVGAAMHSEPFSLFITPLPDADAGMPALAEAVEQAGTTPAGVNGPVAEVQAFVAAWRLRTGLQGRSTGTDRVYEIDAPPPLPDVGAARLVTEADLALATTWMHEFNVEALPHEVVDAEQIVRRRLARGRLLFWETEAGPVSMAGVSRPIAGFARVGAVYTPKPYRRNGFGAAITVAATRQGFADGAERCLLYADLANPTSNRLYLRIGYQPVGDSAKAAFR